MDDMQSAAASAVIAQLFDSRCGWFSAISVSRQQL
jgi:hypothetical protein